MSHEKPPPIVRISAADLQTMDFPPIRWVVDELIPDGLTLLAGKPKLGKSWLLLDVAIAVARGGFTLGDRKVVKGEVLYAALEDNPRRLKGRMAKLVIKGAWPAELTFWTEMPRLDAGGLDDLRAWIENASKPRLIILDTFAKVRSAKGKDENVYDADYRAAGPLKALADEYGVAVVVIHHLRKAESDDPLDAVSGSTGLTGAVDTILVLNRGSEGVTLYGRGRDIAEIETAVVFDKLSCRWSVLGDAAEVHRSKQRQDILQALKLAPDPISPTEIAQVTGLTFGNVRRLLHLMTKDGEVSHPARGKYALS